ncbi:MAG: HprK-related kinase B [Planctomycetes bacterium]|nr:HprK-related kinase B [Planctomycetota bacterium]
MPERTKIEELAARFVDERTLIGSLLVEVGDVRVRVRTDRESLADELRSYFAPWWKDDGVVRENDDDVIDVVAIEADPLALDHDFTDWPRDPGKVGRKEAIVDLDGGRIVKKVRTGMHFLIGPRTKVAIGPCAANSNQIINFVNAQVLGHYYGRGHALCHASGVVMEDGRGIAISGFSGGGKSTLALWLVGDGSRFVSNDRVLIDASRDRARMLGVPKLPRINPGTLLSNPALSGILPAERVEALRRLPTSELWDLEEKYDVNIDRCFGEGRIQSAAPLDAFLILSWDRRSTDPMSIRHVDLAARRELIAAIRKPPGPFWLDAEGNAPAAPIEPNDESYLEALANVTVYEATGRVDFEAAREYLRNPRR